MSRTRLVIGMAALVVAALAGARVSGQIQDRRSMLAPTEKTTDDPRRVPRRAATGARAHVVLRGGRIFDGIGAGVRNGSVLIEGNTIASILPAGAETWPADAEVI